jgi:hypothetical protein
MWGRFTSSPFPLVVDIDFCRAGPSHSHSRIRCVATPSNTAGGVHCSSSLVPKALAEKFAILPLSILAVCYYVIPCL